MDVSTDLIFSERGISVASCGVMEVVRWLEEDEGGFEKTRKRDDDDVGCLMVFGDGVRTAHGRGESDLGRWWFWVSWR